MSEKCPESHHKCPGVVAKNTARKCPNVSSETSSFDAPTRLLIVSKSHQKHHFAVKRPEVLKYLVSSPLTQLEDIKHLVEMQTCVLRVSFLQMLEHSPEQWCVVELIYTRCFTTCIVEVLLLS